MVKLRRVFLTERLMYRPDVSFDLPIGFALLDRLLQDLQELDQIGDRRYKSPDQTRAQAKGFLALKFEKYVSQYMILPFLKASIAADALSSPAALKAPFNDPRILKAAATRVVRIAAKIPR